MRRATQVATGQLHTCALLEGGDMKCWGSNSWYNLGTAPLGDPLGDDPGEMGDAMAPIPLGAGLSVLDMAPGTDGTCVSFAGGGMKCWGYNGYGMVLGIPFPASVSDPVDTLPVQALPDGLNATTVFQSSGTAYALLADGRLVTGTSFSDWHASGETVIAFDRDLSYDYWHVCAVLEGGAVLCGGDNSNGQAGPAPSLPVDLGTDVHATDVVTGEVHSCALIDDGSVKCWGGNSHGQLGQGDTTDRGLDPLTLGDALSPVPLGLPAIALDAGEFHTCALLNDDTVKCWGRNDHGQLGIGTTDSRGDSPGEVAALSGVDLGAARTAVALSASRHSCALLDNGAIKCWGLNSFGQLGQGDTMDRGGAAGDMGDALPVLDLGS